ncbi:MAG: radical SAM protein [Lachnospiraceae bacterium]|nr:radical SAM protein [Lachnospiraceae bacterium]
MRGDKAVRCNLCPRRCGARRDQGELGICRSPWEITAARAALHMWEEPVISGVSGSGTVFFSGCALGCVFCQNQMIASGETARKISSEKLTELFFMLQDKGAHNINLVTGSHYVPQIVKALERAKNQGLTIPVVYNTGSYEKVSVLKMLDGLVDIYLPDLKYKNSELAARYANAPDYFQYASKAIEEMVRQVGNPVLEPVPDKKTDITSGITSDMDADETEGMLMKKGVVVRHLMLPGQLADSKEIIRYLYESFGNRIYISIMNQYTPCNELPGYPELNRKVSEEEYDTLIDYAIELGVEQGFIQEGETAEESFIPAFDYEGIDEV